MTAPLSRTSVLAERHRALGSGLEDWNGMGTAWTYATDPEAEHDAVREAAGMFDMSPLKKVFVRGPEAASVLDHLTTRDISRILPGRSAYLSVLTEAGTMADDAIVSNNGGDDWMIVHGSGDTMALLAASAAGRDVTFALDDDLHDISVQGPNALGLLDAASPDDIGALGYFQHKPTRLFGHPCRISRTGYSGERGYEIFARAEVAGAIWDRLAETGVMPCSFTALDKVRIEAGLLFYGYDMTEAHTPWEVGLGFTVSQNKGAFRGREALMAAKGREAIRNVGLIVDHGDMLAGTLALAGEEVGVINSPCWSHRMEKSLALGHVRADIADGTVLEVIADGVTTTALVAPLPFHDPEKARTHG
ncbi:aminomethyltransferase family protein [Defluviimonas sp. D31]|uniref:aminomethyltransferase family protein n=1 Tax=Defluviimonas sp. D31 TaxID=3083253 RepID=UPI00296F3AB5|nr:aminomethyltransferase family protein [Defluviimonas sp. D31]MDW4548360.1 aminomethyltransferase family protein [Defluviimonas sp. D31]